MNKDEYNLEVFSNLDDPAWDSFVDKTTGGHIAQTSLWAQLKLLLDGDPYASSQGTMEVSLVEHNFCFVL